MDAFPDDFNNENPAIVKPEESRYKYGDKELRKLVFDKIRKGGVQGQSIVFPVDNYAPSAREVVFRELADRFPGCVFWRNRIKYADIDEFVLLGPGETRKSYEWKFFFGPPKKV